MGRIKQGILGGFSGKVANVVGSSWKGTAVVKSRPLSVANPKTAAQMNQRNSMATIVFVSRQMLVTVIKPLWDRFAQGMSGYNAFVSRNIQYFTAGNISDYSSIVISQGKMAATEIINTTMNVARTQLTITFDTALTDPYMLSIDNMYAVAIDESNANTYTQVANTERSTGQILINFKEALPANYTLHLYLAARRQDGTIVSNTWYTSTSA